MGGLHLFEKEEMVAQFRPSRLAYLPRTGGALLWLVWGLIGATVAFATRDQADALVYAFAAMAGLAALTFLVQFRNRARPHPRGGARAYLFALAALASAVGLLVAQLQGSLPPAADATVWPVAIGLAAALLRAYWWEMERAARIHYLTTERLVIRGGLTQRTERTVPLKKVQEVRSTLGPFGQLFDYGDVHLVLGKRRAGPDRPADEDLEVLRGIRHFTENKHRIEELVQAAQLPDRERHRRLEERRVKESMRLLARWMRREGRGGPA